MKKIIAIAFLGVLISNCKTEIKNSKAKVEVEKGTKVELPKTTLDVKVVETTKQTLKSKEENNEELLGFWVGYFEMDGEELAGKDLYIDEGFHWNRENKINISIDKVNDSLVIGHSVVAGNDRAFKGSVKKQPNGGYFFNVKEPGNHKYDGEFIFIIKDSTLEGKWVAYNDIDIKKRKYKLEKKHFVYNPNITLEKSNRYIDWTKEITTKVQGEIDEDEFEEWVSSEFVSATDLIYTINASNKLLSKEEVENLKKGDLTIIRNTIYARHGYSFKNRPLRVFFDTQSWYIPVYADIKSNFTELEKKNIQLLLKYEENATEYYDYFGRG